MGRRARKKNKKVERIKDRCATCFGKLHRPNRFPEDFPDEWKMCCNCKGLASIIAYYGLEDVVRFFIKSSSFLDKRSILKRTKRIKELITLA